MKRYKISHKTHYSFKGLVQLLEHTLRLRPRESHELRIEQSKLEISPKAILRWKRDVEGNSIATATFNQSSQTLSIVSDTIIQQYNSVPQDFLIADYAVNYPFCYENGDNIMLAPYMGGLTKEDSDLIDDWLKTSTLLQQNIETFSLLLNLNQRLFQSIGYCKREEEGVQSVQLTLQNQTGSCRDSASLFMQIARHLGFAARFVSGYLYSPATSEFAGATHAWAEVFIPGAGWKGFDPTIGNIVGDEHIAVAVARLPESVPPIAGGFFGTSGSTMAVTLLVTELI